MVPLLDEPVIISCRESSTVMKIQHTNERERFAGDTTIAVAPFRCRSNRKGLSISHLLVILASCTTTYHSATNAAEYLADREFKIGGTEFSLVEHRDQLTGPNDHLGSLLFDTSGRIVMHDNRVTWMYTGGLVDGKWVSFVRGFELISLTPATRRIILTPQADEKWSTIHLVIRVAEDFYVAFYSTGSIVRAAVSKRPDSGFAAATGFEIAPSQDWERGCSLESDPGFVPIHENAEEFRLWVLYDTLGPQSHGHNGWADVRIDKRRRTVSLEGKHPQNPLALKLANRATARTGGNLEGQFRLANQHYLMAYLSKPDDRTYRLAFATSPDPLFQRIDENLEVAGPLGEESVIEKFHWFIDNHELVLFYEYANRENDWRTAMRRYRLGQMNR